VSDRFEWSVKQVGNVTGVAFRGAVDEDVNFAPLVTELNNRPQILFDLSGIERINSCGVREWVNFVRSLPREARIEMENCTPVVVSQLNMISNFAGAATVKSVFAPFVCQSCGNESNVLLQVEKGTPVNLGEVRCEKCKSLMEFDDIEDSYFAFVKG